jgi:hypothetical protein
MVERIIRMMRGKDLEEGRSMLFGNKVLENIMKNLPL